MKNKLLPLLLLPFLACTSTDEPKEKPIEIRELDYELPYQFARQIERDVEQDTNAWKYQVSAAAYAMKGDYRHALAHWDLAFRAGNNSYTQDEVDSLHQQYKLVNAKAYIVEEAKDHQIVIINEAHHNSMHRFFTRSLLQDLYDQGYRHLGLEALSPGKWMDSSLNERKYPVQASGHYLKDPQFGNLVRTAIEIGYHLFPYEDTTNASGKFREIGQAKQIADMIKLFPNDKFLIHCGFAHAWEGAYGDWEKTMAGRLKEFTNIDPLTINQTVYTERADTSLNAPLLKAMQPQESSVLIDQESGKPFGYSYEESYTDIAVLHPNTSYKDGRPLWLFAMDNQQVALKLPKHDLAYPLMLLAFNEGEELQRAIPMDIVEADSTDETVLFALPKGNYSIVMADSVDAVVFDYEVE